MIVEKLTGMPVQAKLIMAGAALLLAGLVGAGIAHTIAAAEIAQINERNTTVLNTALAAKLAAETRVHALESEGRAATTAALTEYDETHAHEKASADITIANLRDDVVRLRVTTNRASGGGVCAAGPTGSTDHGQAEQTLAGSVAARLAGRYADYNEVVGQLTLCQGQLLRDRKITAPPAE